MPTLQEIMLRAQALRQETAVDSISPERAGSIMYDTLAYINQMQLQGANPLLISKIYASVEAMEADSAPVSDLTGEPLRPGQVVVIATGDPDDPDEGVVYRYDGTEDGASSWTAVGKIGNVEPVDSLDSDSTQLPLAARQGKVLDGKITELGQIATAGPSVILKDYLTKRDGAYNSNPATRKWQDTLEDFGFYTYFGVAIPGASLTISTGAKGTIIYLLKSLPIDNQDVDFAGTESDSLIEIQANTIQDIVIPSSAAYYGIVENVLASGDYEFPQCSISKSGAEILDGKIESLIELTSIIPTLAQQFKNIGLSAFDINALQMGIISFISTSVPSGLPNVDYTVGGLIITTRETDTSWTNQDRQFLITNDHIFERVYYNGWTQWYGGRATGLIKETTTSVPTIDTLKTGLSSFVSLSVPSGFPDLDYTKGCLIITARQSDEQLTNNDHQYIFTQDGLYTRAYWNGTWSDWFGDKFHQKKNVIECGVGKQYTTLRSAVAAAIQTNGTKVVVYPGTYDLTQEFATELANHSGTGILLTNDVHLLFMPGAYVTCMVDVSNEWAYTNFEPFKADANGGNFTLENANINCKNTRYNVHDELGGRNAQYIHRYINCIMEHLDENPIAYYPQCIGGGLGTNGYIEVIGGKYKSTSLYYLTEHYTSPDDMQQPITYHNGNNAACDSKIVIRDVYLADKGYLRFGNYGPSTTLTPVFVSGCRMYKPVFLMNETWDSLQVQNFEVFSFNNEVVNP